MVRTTFAKQEYFMSGYLSKNDVDDVSKFTAKKRFSKKISYKNSRKNQ